MAHLYTKYAAARYAKHKRVSAAVRVAYEDGDNVY